MSYVFISSYTFALSHTFVVSHNFVMFFTLFCRIFYHKFVVDVVLSYFLPQLCRFLVQKAFELQDLKSEGDIMRQKFFKRALYTDQNQEKDLKFTLGAISEQAQDSKMPAVEEEMEGTKRALVSPLKRKVEEVEGERGTKRAMVSPIKRKTGGIIEMWITDESYTSPVKEVKIQGTLDLADDLNLDEEKVETGEEEKKEKEVLKGSVDSSFSSSVHASDLLESSADPDI